MHARPSIVCVLLALFACWNRVYCSPEIQCSAQQRLCPGDRVNATCTIPQNPVLLWILETSDTSYEIDFHIYDNVGDEEKSGPFSATLTKHRVSNPVSESVLSFKFTMELNGTVINCVDVRDGSIRNCSIDVFGFQEKVRNVNATAESCKEILVSWDEPIDVSSDTEYYNVTSVPPTVGNCGLQACSVSATQTSFAKLEYGVSYNVSIAACNCSGCGPDFTLHNVRSKHIPEAELIFRLNVTSPIQYNLTKETENEFQIHLSWKEPFESCALEFRVRMETDNYPQFWNTTTASVNISNLQIEKTFSFSVAGVNGVTGPYSTPVLVYLQVPESVTKITGNISYLNRKFLLTLQWMAPDNGTRPKVDYYLVRYNNQEKMAFTNRFNATLSETYNPHVKLNVTITAVNIIGRGLPNDITINNAGTSTGHLAAVKYIVVSAVFSFLVVL